MLLVTNSRLTSNGQVADSNHAIAYREAMYGSSHMRDYLRMRSETLSELLLRQAQGTHRPLRVLEVGCGPGLSLRHLETALAGTPHQLVGIDMSPDMLQLAGQNTAEAGGRSTFVRASAARLPFADGSFDFAYATRFIHMFREKTPIVDELKRVVRPQGIIAIEFYRRPYHMFRWVAQRAPVRLTAHTYHYPTLSEVRRLVGADARFIALRFGFERLLRVVLSDRRMRALLARCWRTPLRIAVDEYFAVIQRS